MDDFNPAIIAFVCNWCSYAGADKAGGQKLPYPSNVKLIRVMCSGRVDPQFVMKAFREGADGVMVLGCHPGDCHYRNGNMKALRRFKLLERMLSQLGIEKERFKLDWVSAGESARFQELAKKMTDTIKKLGPLHLRGMVESEVA
ncbi:MAG: hydrogenase iron-sulfur subunit [Chitinispirillaceae bacterium]|nr:hydrogenase iron-sulfur subunit [Chitinispirillaceae bacterium]